MVDRSSFLGRKCNSNSDQRSQGGSSAGSRNSSGDVVLRFPREDTFPLYLKEKEWWTQKWKRRRFAVRRSGAAGGGSAGSGTLLLEREGGGRLRSGDAVPLRTIKSVRSCDVPQDDAVCFAGEDRTPEFRFGQIGILVETTGKTVLRLATCTAEAADEYVAWLLSHASEMSLADQQFLASASAPSSPTSSVPVASGGRSDPCKPSSAQLRGGGGGLGVTPPSLSHSFLSSEALGGLPGGCGAATNASANFSPHGSFCDDAAAAAAAARALSGTTGGGSSLGGLAATAAADPCGDTFASNPSRVSSPSRGFASRSYGAGTPVGLIGSGERASVLAPGGGGGGGGGSATPRLALHLLRDVPSPSPAALPAGGDGLSFDDAAAAAVAPRSESPGPAQPQPLLSGALAGSFDTAGITVVTSRRVSPVPTPGEASPTSGAGAASAAAASAEVRAEYAARLRALSSHDTGSLLTGDTTSSHASPTSSSPSSPSSLRVTAAAAAASGSPAGGRPNIPLLGMSKLSLLSVSGTGSPRPSVGGAGAGAGCAGKVGVVPSSSLLSPRSPRGSVGAGVGLGAAGGSSSSSGTLFHNNGNLGVAPAAHASPGTTLLATPSAGLFTLGSTLSTTMLSATGGVSLGKSVGAVSAVSMDVTESGRGTPEPVGAKSRSSNSTSNPGSPGSSHTPLPPFLAEVL